MKNPFRTIRWRKLLRRLAKGAVRVALALLAVLVLAVVALDLYCEAHGLPDWAMDMVQAELAKRNVHCDLREVRAGLLSSVIVEDGTFTVSRRGLDVVLNADRIKARIGLNALLSGQPFLKSLDIEAAALVFRGRRRDAMLPHVGEFSAELRPQAGGAYAISARGLVEGVSLRVGARIRNADALWKREPPEDEQSDRLLQTLDAVTRALRQYRFGSRDAALVATIDADAADWRTLAAEGHWSVSDVVLQGTLAQTFKGQFTASREQIVLRELMVRLNREEHLFGKVVLEPGSGRVWAEVDGQCVPATAFRMVGMEQPGWLERLRFAAPVGFRTVLHPSPWQDRRKWHLEVACEADGFALRDMPVKHMDARIVLRDRTISVPSFAWEIGSGSDRETAVGKGAVWPAEERFSLDLTASLDWARRGRELGVPLPAALRHLATGATPPEVRLTLEKSPYDWSHWQGSASLRADELAVGGRSCRGLRADVRFGGDTVRVERLNLHIGAPGTIVSGRIEARLAGEDRGQVQFDYDLAANSQDGFASSQLLALAGTAFWNPSSGLVSARGEGNTCLARTYEALAPALGIGHLDRIGQFHCVEKPVHVRFTMPECRLGGRDWRVNADVSAEDVRHREIRVREVQTTVSVSRHQISFAGLRGTMATGETFRLNLGLSFSPLVVSVSDGELLGNPLLVETFLEKRRPRQNYRRIWQDFVWDANHPPRFQVPSLVYRDDPEGGGWRLELQGTGEFAEVTFHGVRAKRLALAAKLDLPGTVAVNDIAFVTDQAAIGGDVQLNFDGMPSCDFRFATQEGGCDPRTVLRMIGPDIEQHLDTMEFAGDSKIACTGSFFLAKDPRLNLAGTLETKRWHWGQVDLADVVAKWGVRDTEVRWDIAKATCCKGTLQSTGLYDTLNRSGDLAIECGDASLNAIMAEFGLGEPKPENEAKVALSGRVRFLRDWAGRPVQLAGTGQATVTEGDLWRVPILSQLGSLIDVPLLHRLSRGGTAGLGRITALRADLLFDGERVSIPSLFTDGTVVSLSGSGEYSWRTERMEFDIVGETFRRYAVVSFVTRPLSWVFSAQLTGTRDDYKWHLNNALKRALIGEGDSEKRRIESP